MTKVLNFINHGLNIQRKRYLSNIKMRSSFCEKGNKLKGKTNFVPSKKDVQTMRYRDISKINDEKINKRQENLKVDLVMFIAFYVMLIYLFFSVLL